MRRYKCFSKGKLMETTQISPRHKIRLKYFDLMHSEDTIDGLGILSSDKSKTKPYFEDKKIRDLIDAPALANDEFSIRGWEYIAKSISFYDLKAARQYFEFQSLYRKHPQKVQRNANTCLLLFLYFTFEVVKNMILLGFPINTEHIPQSIESLSLLYRLKSIGKLRIPTDILSLLQYICSDAVKQIEQENMDLNLYLLPHEVREIQEKAWRWYKDLHLTLKQYSVP